MTVANDVANHYSRHDSGGTLGDRILAMLEAAGANLDELTLDDLGPVDAFHARGRPATEELAALANIQPSDEVLDAGCGIGGTSRFLAATFGCKVTGIDLTEEYVGVAEMLSARVGMADRVRFRQGSALEIPFDDGTFDVVWTEHAQMNIADKAGFYGELFRVLKPGGKLAFHDIFAGPESDIHFPVPWADDASISHLVAVEELRGLLAAAGFSQREWEDKTGVTTAFFAESLAKAADEGPPAASLLVLMNDGPAKFANVLRNLKEGRLCLVQAIMKKPGD